MKRVDAKINETKVESLWVRTIKIMRSASSSSEGIKQIATKALRRIPTKRMKRRSRNAFWQTESIFQHFVTMNDAAKQPAAAYIDGVINSFFLDHCPTDIRVLDVGCGTGIVSIFLARHGRPVTACDVSERMLEELARNRNGLNIEIHCADAYHLPFPDSAFDRVVARMFLYHFLDWPVVLVEMARCCSPGGRILVHTPSDENAEAARRLCGMPFEMPDDPPTALSFREKTIASACRRAGLKLVDRIPCSFFHYNRLISYSLGPKGFETYKEQLNRHLSDSKVLDFVVWFEKTVVEHMPPLISYYNILVLEKL
jgi:ubiquinone/menaquinone biosynthesis C-methylase UbiE